jgi:hypothetical protein
MAEDYWAAHVSPAAVFQGLFEHYEVHTMGDQYVVRPKDQALPVYISPSLGAIALQISGHAELEDIPPRALNAGIAGSDE